MKKLLIIPALLLLCGVCKAQTFALNDNPVFISGGGKFELNYVEPSIYLSGGVYKTAHRETTVNTVAYFPADTSFLVEWHSVDTDTAGVQWHSTRPERIYIARPEAAGRLQEIGGDVQVMGEALRTNYGLN